MKSLHACIAAATLMLSVTPVQAASFDLHYTTFDDGINAPVTVDAVLAATADPYTPNGYVVQSITGMRGGRAITGLSDPFSEFYLPASVPGYGFASFLDSFGITFSAAGTDYRISRDPSDTNFYHEYENPDGLSVGRLIRPNALSVQPTAATAVPEPAGWGLMLMGTGMLGWALRRQGARRIRVRFA